MTDPSSTTRLEFTDTHGDPVDLRLSESVDRELVIELTITDASRGTGPLRHSANLTPAMSLLLEQGLHDARLEAERVALGNDVVFDDPAYPEEAADVAARETLRTTGRQAGKRAAAQAHRDEGGNLDLELTVGFAVIGWPLLLAFCKLADVTAIGSWSVPKVVAVALAPVAILLAVFAVAIVCVWVGGVIAGVVIGIRRVRKLKAAQRRAEQARQHHDPVAAQVERSAYVRRESNEAVIGRWSAAAGVVVLYVPERERWQVIDTTSDLRFDVTDDEVRHRPESSPYVERFILVASAKLEDLRR